MKTTSNDKRQRQPVSDVEVASLKKDSPAISGKGANILWTIS